MEDSESVKILKPKPRGHFCAVCRKDFKDYSKHIKSSKHKRSWRERNSLFELSYFEDLFKKYNKFKCNIFKKEQKEEEEYKHIAKHIAKVKPKVF